jgi:hypothetical protein
MVKKIILIMILLSSYIFAANINPDYVSKYELTITKLELKKDDGTYITIFSGSSSINIASASAGEVAGSLLQGKSLPDGIYTHVKVTTGASFVVNACDGSLTTGNCTDNSHAFSALLDDVQVNNPTDSTLTVGVQTQETALSFNVTNSVCSLSNGMSISFDLTGAVVYNLANVGSCGAGSDCIYISTPTITIAKN